MNLISHVAAKLKIYKKFVVYKKVSGRTPASRSPPPAPRVPEKKVAHRVFTVRDSSRRVPALGGSGMWLRPRGSPCQNELPSLPEAGAALLPPLGDTPRDQNPPHPQWDLEHPWSCAHPGPQSCPLVIPVGRRCRPGAAAGSRALGLAAPVAQAGWRAGGVAWGRSETEGSPRAPHVARLLFPEQPRDEGTVA